MRSNEELVNHLVGRGVLKNIDIIRAMSKIDRKDFVGEKNLSRAYEDMALPIGYGQTISQPTTVAFMLEKLNPKEGNKILDIGFGSGWTTAILSEIVGEKGQVVAVEVIPQLKKWGKENVGKYKFKNTSFFEGNGSIGLEKHAPYDRILASAAAPKVPEPLKGQLKEKGRLVIPIGKYTQSIVLVERIREQAYRRKEFLGFMFVEMRGKHGV